MRARTPGGAGLRHAAARRDAPARRTAAAQRAAHADLWRTAASAASRVHADRRLPRCRARVSGRAAARNAAAPGPPSPAGLFVRRVFAGRWDGPLLAALVPALVLLVAAGGLGAWSQHAFKGSAIGWFKRSRVALALAVQGLGGHLSVDVPGRFGVYGSGDADCMETSDSDGDEFDGYDGYDDTGMCDSGAGVGSVSVVPLTFTLLWLLALVLVLRSVRRRHSGPEAAVRVALLSAAVATVLSFVAQPGFEGVTLHSGPFRVLPWSFLLSLATALVVLDGPALRARFAAAWRVAGTALIALVVTVLFAGVVVFMVAVGNIDNGVDSTTLVVLAAVLPNLGLSGLALGWGAPAEAHRGLGAGTGTDRVSFGLSELSHFWNGWSTVLALIGGALCALVIGLLAAARCRERSEQFAVAGVFSAMFTALVVIGGVSTSGISSLNGFDSGLGSSHAALGSDVPESLLFALLWSIGGVLAAPYVRRVLGLAPPAPAPPSPYAPPPFPHVPQQPPPPQQVHELGIVQPERLAKEAETRREEGGGRHQ